MSDVGKLLLGLVVSILLYGCGSDADVSGNGSAPGGIQAVSVYDKGAVVADPVTTSVVITPARISYLQTQAGQAIAQWSRDLELSDYLSLAKVVTEEALVPAESRLTVRNPGCSGAKGMTITVTRDNQSRSYDIPGSHACNRDLWSPGARDVVGIEEALVAKYR